MDSTYQIYLISDSTGETLDRIFIAIKAQFKNIEYKIHTYSFTRTDNQILKILSEAEKHPSSIILYSIVDSNLAKHLANISNEKKIPCFGVLGDLILSFSKLLNQKDEAITKLNSEMMEEKQQNAKILEVKDHAGPPYKHI